jgi:peptide deformylase
MKFTKDNIIVLPNDHLRQRSRKITVVSDEIKKLIADMESATLDWEDSRAHEVGVALAAIQIDSPFRVVIIRNDFEDKKNRSFSVFLNPQITKYEGEIVEDYEGCLSIRDIYGKVPRHAKVRVKAMNVEGKEVRLKVDGFLARVFQHEIDHINGIVFVDHIKDKPEVFFHLEEDGKLKELDYDKDIKDSETLFAY